MCPPLRLNVRWLKKFQHLWRVKIREPPTFEELEDKATKNLEQDYEEKKNTEMEDAFSTLEGEETPIEKIQLDPASDYDVGDVMVEDLLEDESLESHYGLNIVEAKVEGADEHLINAKHIEP